jgi:hypothetical protein
LRKVPHEGREAELVRIRERFLRQDGSFPREELYFSENGLERLVLALSCLNLTVDESSATRIVLRGRIFEFIFEGPDLSMLQQVAHWHQVARGVNLHDPALLET